MKMSLARKQAILKWIGEVDRRETTVAKLAALHGFHRRVFSMWRKRFGEPALKAWTKERAGQILCWIEQVDSGVTSLKELSAKHGFCKQSFCRWRKRLGRPGRIGRPIKLTTEQTLTEPTKDKQCVTVSVGQLLQILQWFNQAGNDGPTLFVRFFI
jgi:hypothetical protein